MLDEDGQHGLADAPTEVLFIHEPAAARRWYGATLLGWVIGGVLGAALFALVVCGGLIVVDKVFGSADTAAGGQRGV